MTDIQTQYAIVAMAPLSFYYIIMVFSTSRKRIKESTTKIVLIPWLGLHQGIRLNYDLSFQSARNCLH